MKVIIRKYPNYLLREFELPKPIGFGTGKLFTRPFGRNWKRKIKELSEEGKKLISKILKITGVVEVDSLPFSYLHAFLEEERGKNPIENILWVIVKPEKDWKKVQPQVIKAIEESFGEKVEIKTKRDC